jgi:hypothetical protein
MPTHNQVRRERKIRHFKETIELSKVINSCLACYYLGETHMYRPLSAQLRILFCDIQKGKNKALLPKLFDKLNLSPVKTTKYQQQGSFTSNDEWANNIVVKSPNQNVNPKIAIMPFEITVFKNGLEVCELLLDDTEEKIGLDEWLKQVITFHPSRISIIDLIRSVADRGGGAHIHNSADSLLNSLQKTTPCKTGIDALLTIALGRFAQQIGWMVTQFYEQFGTKGKIENLVLDQNHPSITECGKIPEELFHHKTTKFNLTSVTLV